MRKYDIDVDLTCDLLAPACAPSFPMEVAGSSEVVIKYK